MDTMASEESLSSSFDRLLQLYRDIEASTLPTTHPEMKAMVSRATSGLVRATVLTSQMDVFSSNETLEDLPTSSLKLLLLPALLGLLTLKQTGGDNMANLSLATTYLRDYLRRCRSYGVTTGGERDQDEEQEEEEDEEEGRKSCSGKKDVKRNGPPTLEDLQKMARQREKKIRRYNENRELQERLKALGSQGTPQDEETQRTHTITLLRKVALDCLEELDSLARERKMLKEMATMQLREKGEGAATASPQPSPAPRLKPILITRDAAQKNVFGLGYPSRPTMTVEEFYDQRVKEGWFPQPRSSREGEEEQNTHSKHERKEEEEEEEEKEEKEEEEDDGGEALERARARDEWRDTHRTGWGNTYNRS